MSKVKTWTHLDSRVLKHQTLSSSLLVFVAISWKENPAAFSFCNGLLSML